MAEFIAKEMYKSNNNYFFFSRALSAEEIGNDLYPGAKRNLDSHHIPYARHYAKRLTNEDVINSDIIFVMETYHVTRLINMFPNIDREKIKLLHPKGIDDPWPYGPFEETYQRIVEGLNINLPISTL